MAVKLHGAAASPGSSVVASRVELGDAEDTLLYLRNEWSTAGGLRLPSGRSTGGFATYGRTVGVHDGSMQRKETLVFCEALLPEVRLVLPGFERMELFLAAEVRKVYHLSAAPVLLLAHALRQSPTSTGSTIFDEHTDDDEDSRFCSRQS